MPYAYIKKGDDIRRIGGSTEVILDRKLKFEAKQGWELSSAEEYIAAGNEPLDDNDTAAFEGDAANVTDAGFRDGEEFAGEDEVEAPVSEEASEEAEA